MLATHLGFYNTATSRTHVRFQFSTHAAAGGNVAPNSAFEAADLRIYKAADGAAFSATQRSSANGITMTSPFDSLTGFHDVDIDLTDNTDAGFYAAGSLYSVVLSPDETVDSQTLTGVVLAYFEIGRPQTDVREFGGTAGTFASGRPEVNTTHAAGTAWGSGAITAASIAADAITAAKIADGAIDAGALAADCITAAKVAADVSAEIADAVLDEDMTGHQTQGSLGQAIGDPVADANTIYGAVVTGAAGATIAADIVDIEGKVDDLEGRVVGTIAAGTHEPQSGDSFARLGAPAGASVSADIAAVKSDTAAILVDTGTTLDGRIPAALVGGRMDSSVGAMATDVLTAAAVATSAVQELRPRKV